MGIFSRRRDERARLAQLENETERMKSANALMRNQNAEIRAKERLVEKMMQGPAQGSMTGDLYNQEFPSGGKFRGAMSLYRSHWHGSNDHLRHISRIAEFESPTGGAMVDRLSTTTVGWGLRLQSEPMWDLIGQEIPGLPLAADADMQREWRTRVEHRYRLWWKSYGPSFNLDYNGYQMDQAAFWRLLVDGEYFVVLRYSSARRGSPLTMQFIPPENVTGGIQPANGNVIENGIEYDDRGAAVAYHILHDKTGITTRVPRFSPTSGRVMVIHNYIKKHERQRRGVPYLSSIVHELTKLGDYEVLEIQAAVINALFAVWVKPPQDEDGQPLLGAGAQKKGDGSSTESGGADAATREWQADVENLDFSHGGVIADALPAGHTIESFDTKRPNLNFGGFFDAVKTNLAASKGQPLAVVDLKFNNSYSGARGELLLFWMTVDKYRINHGWDFHDDIYKMWMWAEVDRGKIEAPGFATDEMLRDAYANAKWIGNQRPDIDPMKTVSSNILKQGQGYSTGHEITAETEGGDYEENLTIIQKEFERLAPIKQLLQTDDVRPTSSRVTGGPGGGK